MRILRYFSYLFIFSFIPYFALADDRIGIIGIVVGQADVVNRNIEIKIKENIYFGDVIRTGAQTNLQILFDDETVFTIGENTEIVINEFIYDPNQNDELNKISAEVLQGSLKVVTGLISKQNPENLSIVLPTGVLATRGTEVQALVKPGQNDVVVLLGPGPKRITTSFSPGFTSACTSVPRVARTPVGRVINKFSGFSFEINPVTTFKDP